MKLHAELAQVVGQHLRGKAGLLLVEVDGDQVKMDRRALLQFQQNVEHGVAVFSARDADHHLVAFLNHVEVDNRPADLAAQALFQLVIFALDLHRVLHPR